MARKRTSGEVSQADAVRQGWEALGPTARGVDVISYVDEHHPQLGLGRKTGASAVVSGLKQKVFGKRRRRKRKAGGAAGGERIVKRVPRPSPTVNLPLLIQAKELVANCGSADQAIAVIEQLRKLQLDSIKR